MVGIFVGKIKEKNSFTETELDRNSKDSSSQSLWRTVLLLAFTDLAFSVDSVAAAVAISDQFLLVVTGALIGVLALRFTSGLFVKWLEIFSRLELAGYIAVGLVGIKLLLQLIFPSLDIPESITLLIVILLFVWGFSEKSELTTT